MECMVFAQQLTDDKTEQMELNKLGMALSEKFKDHVGALQEAKAKEEASRQQRFVKKKNPGPQIDQEAYKVLPTVDFKDLDVIPDELSFFDDNNGALRKMPE